MSVFNHVRRLLQASNYKMNPPAQMPYYNQQRNNGPGSGSYQSTDTNYNYPPPSDYNCPAPSDYNYPTTSDYNYSTPSNYNCQTSSDYNHPPSYQFPFQNYQNENFYEDNFGNENFTVNVQYQHQNNYKRPREWNYNDNWGANAAKKIRLAEPTVQYAFKKCTTYTYPLRKALVLLFEPEIMADGWEKVNRQQIRYHTKIREVYYSQLGISIEDAQENVAGIALQKLMGGVKWELISWPQRLLSFRLDQPFADAIEILVKNRFDAVMVNDVQYKAHKVRCGIVMTIGASVDDATVVAIGTGSKCLADKHQDGNGTILHDMHAEVLARRGFVRFLYDQLIAMVDNMPSIFHLNGDEIQLRDDVKFHLYVNSIPCGDARVFSLKGCAVVKKLAKQGTLRSKKIGGTENLTEANDAQRVKSMSCSDKIARWNVLGLQGAVLSKYIKPIYLESIVLGSSYIPIHFHRAIFGRLESALSDLPLPDGYRLNKPKFESTFVMEVFNSLSSEDHGVCWSDGYNPEILNLHTGMKKNGKVSTVSKSKFMNKFQTINEKLPNRSDSGIDEYSKVKGLFYGALKKKNFGVWETS